MMSRAPEFVHPRPHLLEEGHETGSWNTYIRGKFNQQPDIVRRLRLNLGHLKTCAAQWDPTLHNTFSIYKDILFKHLIEFLFRKHLVAYFKRNLISKAPIPSQCISARVSQSFFEPPPPRDLAVFPTTLKLRIRYTMFLAESGRMNLVGPTHLWSHRV